MSRQKSKDTKPEVDLRRALHRRGRRFRVNLAVPGATRRTIDIAFPGRRVAVLVDGCFWHGCPEHATWPMANGEFWHAKITRNQARDVETNELLEAAGWTVCRIWEHTPIVDAVVIVESYLDGPASRVGDGSISL